jgi:hypothetical protein
MTLNEQDEFIQHIMANRDAEMVASTLVEWEVNESDFVRSSG